MSETGKKKQIRIAFSKVYSLDGQTKLSFEQELLALMREQGEAIKKMAITMESIQKHVVLGKSMQVFEMSYLDWTILDEQPFPSRDIEHEPAWEGVFKTRTASTNEQVEIWKSGMDADLIFVRCLMMIIRWHYRLPLKQDRAFRDHRNSIPSASHR